MISLPFRRPPKAASIDALYGMIVAQARSPAFYRDYGVPDTVDGRLDMILLHLVLLLRQLARNHGLAVGMMPPVAKRIFDRFCQDIDDNFREMGVGDLTVPKKMRSVAEAFYGRAKVYENALADDNVAVLEAAVARNVFGASEPLPGAVRLAAYMREASRKIGTLAPDALERAEFDFPDPVSEVTFLAQGSAAP